MSPSATPPGSAPDRPDDPATGPRCTDDARASGEPLAGTAPRALGWMLIEVSGSWGHHALTESGLDPAVGAELARRVADLDVKVVLIRRPGRHVRAAGHHRVILAHTGAQPWLRTTTVPRDTDLLDLDPALTLQPRPPATTDPTDPLDPEAGGPIGFEPLAGPLWLVCTHARRDRCCASYGRPVADTLAALHPDTTWEVSHIGGHRFAANLLTLPTGLTFGGLDVTTAATVVAALETGSIDLTALRGRTGASREAQAAEIAARHHLGVAALDIEVQVTGPHDPPDAADDGGPAGSWRVRLGDHHLDVEVARAPLGRPRQLSCDAGAPEDPAGIVVRGVSERH